MPKRLIIQENKIFRRINNKRISSNMKMRLFELYKEDEILVRKILDCMDIGWQAIQEKISSENIALVYPIENYKADRFDLQSDRKHMGKQQVTIQYTYEDSCLTFVALV